MLFSEAYRELNRQKHALGSYGIAGHRWASEVHGVANRIEARSVLDYGCGQGTLAAALRKLNPVYAVHEYDPAIDGKEEKPLRADLVVCNDVLEHIEPECLYAVLDDLRDLARIAVFLVIETGPAMKHLADGRNCHLIQEKPDWWLPKLMARWNLQEFRNGRSGFVAVANKR